MNRRNLLIVVAVAVLAAGVAVSYLNYSSSQVPTKCEKIEKQAKEQQQFNGTLACYPPGVIDVNISDEVEERANLDCVCKKTYNGSVQLFPILSTGNSTN